LRILAEDLEGDARDKVLQLLANTGAEHAIYDLFKRDVAACLHAFLNTSTLQNKITELNATRIFRLGRYLTFLNRPHIIASVSALLPSEKEVSDRAELDVFLIGRRGFLGIHKDYFAHSASFLFEFTQPSIGAYFKEVDKAATAVDWRITEATVTKRVFIRSSRAYARDPKTHFDRVTLLHQSPRNIICTTELIHGGELFPDSHSAESSRGQSFQRSR